MRKLSNTEAELEKSVAYKKKRVNFQFLEFFYKIKPELIFFDAS